MSTRNISISLLLALTLGLTGCGGGGGTPDPTPTGTVEEDTTAPIITNDDDIDLMQTIEEGSTSLELATIVAEDPSGVTFDLGGVDKSFFELTETKTRSTFSTVLKFKDIPDYEIQPVYRVSVNVRDSKNNVTSRDFEITLIDKPFVFDIIGSMGTTQEEHTDRLKLSVKEPKLEEGHVVNYRLQGDTTNFKIIGDEIVFTAPKFVDNDPDKNRYTTTVIASDDEESIEINISATVSKYAVNATVMRLKEKRELRQGNIIVTTYGYKKYDDNKSYLIERNETGGREDIHMTYEYNDDFSIMKGYKDGVLTNVRTFVQQADNDNPFTAEQRLSVSKDTHFIYHIADSAAYNQNRKLTKFVKGLEVKQAMTERYTYNSLGAISKVESGFYKTGYDENGNRIYIKESDFEALRDDTTSELPEFIANVANLYEYDSRSDLSKIKYDEHDDGTIEHEDKVRVTYGGSLISHVDIYTAGIYYSYKSDGFIDQIEHSNDSIIKKYVYSSDLKKVEIKVGDDTLTTYIFEEE